MGESSIYKEVGWESQIYTRRWGGRVKYIHGDGVGESSIYNEMGGRVKYIQRDGKGESSIYDMGWESQVYTT